MKRRLPVFAEAAVLSVLAAWSAVGCLQSAFSLQLRSPNTAVLIWLVWAVLCAAALLRRWGGAALLASAAVGAAWLWYDGTFGTQAVSLLGILAKAYDGGYGFGVPEALQVPRTAQDLTLAVWGMGIIFAVSRTVCRRRGNALPVLLLLLSLAACLVLTDTVPQPPYLFGLLLTFGLLLLTDSVRRESGGQASRLSAAVAAPLAAALALLFYCFPQSSYVNNTQALRENLLTTLNDLPQMIQAQGMDLFSGLRPREKVELSSLPTQLLLGIPVAEVTAEQSGSVYLRVQDYDIYTGTAWESTPSRQDTLAGSGSQRGGIEVRMLSNQRNQPVPAFPDGQIFLTGGAAEKGAVEQSFLLREFSLAAYPGDQWLLLPEATGLQARALIQSVGIGTESVEQTVQAVAEYVHGSAVYDRSGTTMPEDAPDFALWFLQEAEEGYCVHFATAAAVLLRSAGIPARYVTGYRVDVKAGEPVQVTSNDAHAWVEYYNYRTWGWYILEATPAAPDDPGEAETAAPTEAAVPTASQTPEVTSAPITQPLPTQEDLQPPAAHPRRTIPVWIPVTLGTLALLALLAEGQRRVRIELRRRRQKRGSANQRAAACARELQLLSRLTRTRIPEEVTELTEKAVFSQHTLTAPELRTYALCQSAYRRRLRAAPWWKKALCRYWYAVI